MYILEIILLSDVVCKYFLLSNGLSFHSVVVSFDMQGFNFEEVQFIYIFSFVAYALVSYPRRNHC